MNSVLDTVKCRDGNYPVLMVRKGTGIVVLFKSKHSGTVVNSGKSEIWEVGEVCNNFNMDIFVPYNGKVILFN